MNITLINNHSRRDTFAFAEARESKGICCCTRHKVWIKRMYVIVSDKAFHASNANVIS